MQLNQFSGVMTLTNLIKKRGLIIAIIVTLFTLLILLNVYFSNSVTVKISQLNVRSGPGVNYSLKGTVKRGTHLQVTAKKNNWLKVVANHKQTGWVASWLVDKTTIGHHSKLAETTIVLDPGHGGDDTGALSNTQKYEKKYTLQIAKRVAQQLRSQGARVILTRSTDKTASLVSRPALAEKVHADAFISFHLDSSDVADSASGVTSYYYHDGASKRLATNINNQLRSLPLPNRGVQFGDFLVIRNNTVPAVLLETGYINSNSNFKRIKSIKYQNQIAQDVVTGLNNYF